MLVGSVVDPDPYGSVSFGRIRIRMDQIHLAGSGSVSDDLDPDPARFS